jgi:hypothetical protein
MDGDGYGNGYGNGYEARIIWGKKVTEKRRKTLPKDETGVVTLAERR